MGKNIKGIRIVMRIFKNKKKCVEHLVPYFELLFKPQLSGDWDIVILTTAEAQKPIF